MNPRKDYKAALALRLEGKTYGEIRKAFGIPKSTQSVWFQNLKLPSRAKSILTEKHGNGLRALQQFNIERTSKIRKENEDIRNTFKARIGRISQRELMIMGAVLYWGEGYKNFNPNRKAYPHVSFANSDPLMIKAFISFLEKVLNIERGRMRAEVMLYPNLVPQTAVEYWQKITGIPQSNFCFYVALSRASKKKRPQNLLPYGTLQLKVNRRQEFFKIRGLMDGIVEPFEV